MVNLSNLRFDDRAPVYQQIAEYLKRQILLGTVQDGDPMPSRRELAAQTGINPNTAQKAYRLMTEEGYVVTDGNSGSFVRLTPALREQISEELTRGLVEQFVTQAKAKALLLPAEKQAAAWFDTPMGHLDTPLLPSRHIDMAANGSLIANFFNQVQLEASGADISATSLGNSVKGLGKDVTIRDIVSTYVFPNTLKTVEVCREQLKKALERSAEYFALENGGLAVSECFLKPIEQHFNYDYISGVEVTEDIRRPIGDRVV